MRGDISEIEKLVEGGSVLLSLLLFGTAAEFVKNPIEFAVSRIYGYIHPEVRKPFEAAVSKVYGGAKIANERVRKSRAYENAKMARKSLRKSFYNDISLDY